MSMTLNGDFDDLLRQALHAEVDSVEPAADGLERILHRAREPWLLRQLSLMLTECADLFWLVAIRLGPGVSKLRQAITTPTGPGVSKLRQAITTPTGLLAAPAGRRHASARRHARSGSRLAWIRPALAVSAAVVLVVVGVYGMAQLRQSLVLDLFPNGGVPATTGPGPAHRAPSVQGHSGGPLPVGPGSVTVSPRSTCTKATQNKSSPTPSTTPSTNPSGSPSVSPSPSATPTASPSVTGAATTTAFVVTTSDVSLAGHCTRARPSKSARAP